MPRTARITIENAYYHIITRGNQKQSVFLDSRDYQKYLYILKKYKKKYNFKIYGFCLMPNHIHIIIQVENPSELSKIMTGINLSYTLSFNFKYKKIGHLWQDRFKSKVIEKDAYLLECLNYIEANPIRAGLVTSLSEYRWSSYSFRNAIDTKDNILDSLFLTE